MERYPDRDELWKHCFVEIKQQSCTMTDSLGDTVAAAASADSQEQRESSPSPTLPACNTCRKVKLRCSRETPKCQYCRRIGAECVYETKRSKPGPKAGAVETIHRRLDALEEAFHQREREQDRNGEESICGGTDLNGGSSTTQKGAALEIITLLAKELPKLVRKSQQRYEPLIEDPRFSLSRKRRRVEDEDSSEHSPRDQDEDEENHPPWPPKDLLEAIVTAHFVHLHPWIPMIHEGRFRRKMSDPDEALQLELVIHAMIVSSSRFIRGNQGSSFALRSAWSRGRLRRWIVTTAMETLSIESLQALIIIVFMDIGDGNIFKAWSLIASLTRTVEYTQLAVECEEGERQPLSQPFTFLPPATNWTETEERRRIFWNVFNLDRFCSITMGWSTSLTSDDCHRRLPVDGYIWRKQEQVITPYMGIWDKSAGRIGNPIAFMPPNHQAQDQTVLDKEARSPGDIVSSPGWTAGSEISTIGAFAYCIEATESMSRVTSYFLQQKVDMHDERQISSWLTRFKELDLRLVYWKVLLPKKWKADMARQTTKMDPNLTLAHVTHNTSMILLHQVIAYPPPEWRFRDRLPSSCSAGTCHSAGTEIATITKNYLRYTPEGLPLGNQYAFCLFIAARMLLVHWRYYTEDRLADEFWLLIECLDEMSRRWVGPDPGHGGANMNLATKYASKLKELHRFLDEDASHRVDVTLYTAEIDHQGVPKSNASTQANKTPQDAGLFREVLDEHGGVNHEWQIASSIRHANEIPDATGDRRVPGRGPSGEVNVMANPGTYAIPLSAEQGDDKKGGEYETAPYPFLDQNFMQMDRVISFDNGSMFVANMEGNGLY